MEHTKGEWVLGYDNYGNGGYSEWYTVEASSKVIAKVGESRELSKTDKANAYLIASAPGLHKGLKDALAEICRLCVRLNPQHEDCQSCEDMEQRREALAKAEGK